MDIDKFFNKSSIRKNACLAEALAKAGVIAHFKSNQQKKEEDYERSF